MKLPETHNFLTSIGWVFNRRCNCRGCNKEIEWWKDAFQQWKPMEVVQEENRNTAKPRLLDMHHKTCPQAEQFRKTEEQKLMSVKQKKDAEKAAKKEPQGSLF